METQPEKPTLPNAIPTGNSSRAKRKSSSWKLKERVAHSMLQEFPELSDIKDINRLYILSLIPEGRQNKTFETGKLKILDKVYDIRKISRDHLTSIVRSMKNLDADAEVQIRKKMLDLQNIAEYLAPYLSYLDQSNLSLMERPINCAGCKERIK